MNERLNGLRAAVDARRGVKVIAGINNYELETVRDVVRAAEAGGADAVDVAARQEIVEAARELFTRALVVSSVEPTELVNAVRWGADVVELGNFDALYAEGRFFDAETVLKLAEETVTRVREIATVDQAWISVTVPGHLAAEHQVSLTQRLEKLGVDLIQTEGAVRVNETEKRVDTLTPERQLELTLANTRVLVKATRLPVMTATAITPETIVQAFEAGASMVGVGRAVREVRVVEEMTRRVQTLVERSRGRELTKA